MKHRTKINRIRQARRTGKPYRSTFGILHELKHCPPVQGGPPTCFADIYRTQYKPRFLDFLNLTLAR